VETKLTRRLFAVGCFAAAYLGTGRRLQRAI
jgi:hypothetical protein